ncbi:hypothetical protein PKHYL_23630 [Psychrobacter sp. KH172YL61]|uniref:hypothetical protein n=1 Tax=Psychrobacter sp. KH172YL61 TaxID=2517899 RepID=UPI0010B7E1BC|nr:hypothetical protein PKHYL_23630 [Psychrobacter sp. KH172YL61]
MKPATQDMLSRNWGGFYKALTARNILGLDGLIEELVSQLLERNMKKKIQELIKTLIILSLRSSVNKPNY